MSDAYVRNVIEAALLAAGAPLPLAELGRLFADGARPGTQELRAALAELASDYAGRGIELKETASGFRVQVRRELAPEISRLWPERATRYSRALLETLALIAYRQPITRAEIEAVRGVAVNPNIIRTVIERSWVRVVGHRDVPGHPELLGTTREFLDYFGLKSLDELPPLAQIRALVDINLQLGLSEEPASVGEEPAAAAATPEVSAGGADEASDGDDGGDEDELSAQGNPSRELVAGPSSLDD
jgi:segregation and condensation protein B